MNKLVIVIFSVLMSSMAFGSDRQLECFSTVEFNFSEFLRRNTEFSFEILEPISRTRAIEELNNSTEWDDDQKEEIIESFAPSGEIFYLGHATEYGGSGYFLVRANESNCEMKATHFIFAD